MPKPLLPGSSFAVARPGRVGPARSAKWITAAAEADGRFEVEVVDLRAEVNLPMFDEPKRPAVPPVRAPAHQVTGARSSTGRTRGSIFVVPEYNYGYNAANGERHRLPEPRVEVQAGRLAASYGGVAAGTRAQCSSSSR